MHLETPNMYLCWPFVADLGPREWSRLGNGRGVLEGRFSGPHGDHYGPIRTSFDDLGRSRLSAI